MKDINCKVLVIGAGPGGYVCAIRAGQLGLDTVIIEKAKLGGTCLNVGCIPSKALIHAADKFHELTEAAAGQSPLGFSASNAGIDFSKTMSWKSGIVTRLNQGVGGLLKKAGVKSVQGHARFADGKNVEVDTGDGIQKIKAETIVIATGSLPVELPFLPFGDNIISSTEALELNEIPKTLAVVGSGYIGVELGTAFAKLGCKVTAIEAADRILPQYDKELTRPVAARLEALGIDVITGALATGTSDDGTALKIKTEDGTEKEIRGDKILVTVGRKPAIENAGIGELALDMNGPFIDIDKACRTSMRGIFAIGDITGEPMLAHRAMAQGEMVAEIIAGKKREWDKYCIPAICFSDPEIVSAGLSPSEAEEQNIEIKTGQFPFQANGRAMTTEREDGFIRVVARADNHVVIGLEGVGAGISELAASFAMAIEMGSRLEDIAQIIHAHPTRSEALHEASLKALGHALHI